jgi:hypothetical protein
MSRLSFAISMSGLGALVIGIAAGCGTNEKLEDDDDGAGGGPGVIGGAGNGTGGRATGGRGAVGGGGGGGPVSTTPLGKTCLNDTDCGEGLFCALTSGNEFEGGAAGGVCTLDCSSLVTGESETSPCSDIDENAVCVAMSDTVGYCLEGCFVGPPVGGAGKCHKRNDMVCYQGPGDEIGYCQPACRGDFECKGRKCDLARGVCVDELEGTLPLGAKCDPDAEQETCKGGFCVAFSSAVDGGPVDAFCSGMCRIGSVGCGEDPSVSTVGAVCLLSPLGDASSGDFGFCAQLCDCDDDCGNDDFVCEALPEELQTAWGKVGACSPPIGADGPVTGIPCNGPRPVPDGGGTPDAAPASDAATD